MHGFGLSHPIENAITGGHSSRLCYLKSESPVEAVRLRGCGGLEEPIRVVGGQGRHFRTLRRQAMRCCERYMDDPYMLYVQVYVSHATGHWSFDLAGQEYFMQSSVT